MIGHHDLYLAADVRHRNCDGVGLRGVARCVVDVVVEDLLKSRKIDANRPGPINTRALAKPKYGDTKQEQQYG